jgi:hypothetical protein
MITHQPYPSDVSDPEWEFVRKRPVKAVLDMARGASGGRDQPYSIRWPVDGDLRTDAETILNELA